MSDDQLGLIGIICLFLVVGILYFQIEISDFFRKKRKERARAKLKLTAEELEEKERSGWKTLFTDNVLAPLVIGHIIGGIGYIFENDTMGWIGVAFIVYGFYLMLRNY